MFRSIARVATIVGVGAILGVTVARAQDKLSFQGQGGVAIPGKQLHQFVSAGPSANLDVGYSIRSRIAVDLFGGFSRLKGQPMVDGPAPSMDATDLGVGIRASLLPVTEHHWSLVADAGIGASALRTDQFPIASDSTLAQFKHAYPATRTGLEIGYHFGPRVGVFVGTDLLWAFVKSDDTAMLGTMNGSTIQPFNKAWTAPITLGFKAEI